jgi:hypothetical protein
MNLLLETSKCDLSIKNEPGFEYWWIVNDTTIVVMAHHPHNSPKGFICTMEPQTAVSEWTKLITEGWELGSYSTPMAEIIEASRLMEICGSCGEWSVADEDDVCFICGDLFSTQDDVTVEEVANV